jgi:hypothetical protein
MRLALLFSVALAMIGCDHRREDCRRLVDRVNEAVDHLQPARVKDSGPPAEVAAKMRRFGESTQAQVSALEALDLTTPELIAQRDAYVTMAKNLAEGAGGWARALDDLAAAQKRGQAAKRALDDNLDQLEARCSGSTCFDLMKALGRPRDTGDVPKSLDELAESIEGMTTEDAAVNRTIGEHVRQLRALATALRAMTDAERATKKAEGQLAEAAEREGAIVDRINAICGST